VDWGVLKLSKSCAQNLGFRSQPNLLPHLYDVRQISLIIDFYLPIKSWKNKALARGQPHPRE
jgi:hypothetical protein